MVLDTQPFAGNLTVSVTGTPVGTTSFVAQLSTGSTVVATQSFPAPATSFTFGNLLADTPYSVTLQALDAGNTVLANGTSTAQTFVTVGANDVEQNATLAVVLVPPAPYTVTALGGQNILGIGVAVDPKSHDVWLTDESSANLTELSSTGSILGTFNVGFGYSGVAVDPVDEHVWVLNYEEDGSGQVMELSSTGSVLGTFVVGRYPNGVAVDPTTEQVWVVGTAGSLTELSSTGSVLGTFALAAASAQVAVDPTSHNIWVTNYGFGAVTELSSAGHILDTFNVGTRTLGVAVDSTDEHVWVTNYVVGTVSELSSTGSVLGTFNVANPMGVAVDATGHVRVANNVSSGTVTELTSTGSVLGTLSAGSDPGGLAVDSTTHHVWTSYNEPPS